MLIYYHLNTPSIQTDTSQHLKQLNSENKLALLTILVFIAVRLSLHMISANASPQGKNLNMGLLSIHPTCYPLAVQRQLGMLKPERANRTLSRIHGSQPSTKASGAAGRIWQSVARRQSVEQERAVTHCCF